MVCNAFDIFAKRHSFYEINQNIPCSKDDITEMIFKALELYPSPFNSQSSRLLVLYQDTHKNFWNLVEKELLNVSAEDKKEAIKKRITSFSAGFGTILYFVDMNIIHSQEKAMPLYAENFKNWAMQSSAMLQFMIWSAFANSNIGASLQHYNPLINQMVEKAFNIDKNWELVAQMPFGGIKNVPQPHVVENLSQKISTF